jgi:ATP-dependent Lon protease
MATAIVSALRDQKVREDVAMTGEITLSGLVLPVGGIREKALAARRHGIKTFILPAPAGEELIRAGRSVAAAILNLQSALRSEI